MASAHAPEEDGVDPPPWLRPDQVSSFRRVVLSLRRHRGAILADPVGSGKTYVALAAASVLNPGRVTACLVPAPLVPQWRTIAAELAVPVVVTSHTAASLGHLPRESGGMVVIDEAHHFRNPATLRYRHVAPWLIRRPVLLVTATPVVNRLDDLLHQLLLGVRDDTLAADGIPSLRALLRAGRGAPALGRVVVESPGRDRCQPARYQVISRPGRDENEITERVLSFIDRLRLSRLPSTSALIRTVLVRAAASSPAALAGALRRYRGLLAHARDAAAVGRPVDRSAIRRFTGELENQLVWWELLPPPVALGDLTLEDLDSLDDVVRGVREAMGERDGKLERLRALLADGKPSLVFASRRETVRYLRDRLDGLPLAWCTGDRSGLGRLPAPRAVVLQWFREGPHPAPPKVRHLLVTDVAAEGLDLQRAGRVVHYDLPWTPVRLSQREGRALRLGSRHREVEVVLFAPPAPLERALQLRRLLSRKAALPSRAGLGPWGHGLWRWRAELVERFGRGEGTTGVAVVPAGPPGVLGGFSIHPAGESERVGSALVWAGADGDCTEDQEIVVARVAHASLLSAGPRATPEALRRGLALLVGPMRARLALVQGARWAAPPAPLAGTDLAVRLHAELRDAARARDAGRLALVERALDLVRGGLTAGETMVVERLGALHGVALSRALARLPARKPTPQAFEVRLAGLILFEPR